jgi:hypothetical protein
VIQLEEGDSPWPTSLPMSGEMHHYHADTFMTEALVLPIALIIMAG